MHDMLNLYDKHEMGSPELFERIITIIPINVRLLAPSQLARVFQIMVKKNLGIYIYICIFNIGSDRVFEEFIYIHLERKAAKFPPYSYILNINNLAIKKWSVKDI